MTTGRLTVSWMSSLVTAPAFSAFACVIMTPCDYSIQSVVSARRKWLGNKLRIISGKF